MLRWTCAVVATVLVVAVADVAFGADDPITVSQARSALDSKSISQRVTACRVLGRDGKREDVPALLERLQDPVPAVREAAVDALGALGHEIAVPRLIRSFEDPVATIRGRAVIVVGKLGGKYAIPAVTRRLTDPSVQVRICAIQALGSLDATLQGPRIREALESVGEVDADRVALATAIVSLARLEGKSALPDLFEQARESGALEIWLVRSALVWAIGHTRDAARLPFVRRALTDSDERVYGPAARVLLEMGEADTVTGMLAHEDPKRRRVAVAAMAERDGAAAVEVLRRALRDDDGRVVLEAAVGLSKRGEAESVPTLIRGLTSPNPSIWTECARELDRAYEPAFGRDAEAWVKWYREHRDRLKWDAENRVWRE